MMLWTRSGWANYILRKLEILQCAVGCWRCWAVWVVLWSAGSNISARTHPLNWNRHWAESGDVWASERQDITKQTVLHHGQSFPSMMGYKCHCPTDSLRSTVISREDQFTTSLYNSSALSDRWTTSAFHVCTCCYSKHGCFFFCHLCLLYIPFPFVPVCAVYFFPSFYWLFNTALSSVQNFLIL